MIEFFALLLLAVGKIVCTVFIFVLVMYFGGYLFRKWWDAAGKKGDAA